MSIDKNVPYERVVTLNFSAMSPSLRKQLRQQKHPALNPKVIDPLERDAEAITRLYLRNVLPPAAVHKARQKVLDRVVAALEVAERKRKERSKRKEERSAPE